VKEGKKRWATRKYPNPVVIARVRGLMSSHPCHINSSYQQLTSLLQRPLSNLPSAKYVAQHASQIQSKLQSISPFSSSFYSILRDNRQSKHPLQPFAWQAFSSSTHAPVSKPRRKMLSSTVRLTADKSIGITRP
jgi:hypothetical protein